MRCRSHFSPPRRAAAGPSSAAHRTLATRWLSLGLLAAALLTGCQAPPQPAGRTSMVLRVADFDAFWDDSVSMLRRYDFAPEFADRAQGVVVSQPATSGQWFELWRVDSRGLYQSFESSIHTMRRVVTVQIEPLDGTIPPMRDEDAPATVAASVAGDETAAAGVATTAPATEAPRYRVVIRVDKSRYSAPERQVTTASGAMSIYSERLPTTEGLRPRGYTVQWVPLGRDGLLEAFLLDEIAKTNPSCEPVDDPTPPAVATR